MILKDISKKYFICTSILITFYLGTFLPNRILAFFSETILITLFIPLIVYIFQKPVFFILLGDKELKLSKDKIAVLLTLILFLLFNNFAFLYYMDIPNVVNRKYKKIVAKAKYTEIKRGIIEKEYFFVGDNQYYVYPYITGHIELGQVYEVEILENSKFLINIKKVNN